MLHLHTAALRIGCVFVVVVVDVRASGRLSRQFAVSIGVISAVVSVLAYQSNQVPLFDSEVSCV